MAISNRVKRNIFLTLTILAIMVVISRIVDVVMDPRSGKEWLDLAGGIVIGYIVFDRYLDCKKRV